MSDAIIIGGGIAGMATAARLQAAGLSTMVIEAHGQPGGCAGFFRSKGFAFDVGATTLVDFAPGGVGGELLDSIGLFKMEAETLPGYVAWLPDLRVMLHRDPAAWAIERLAQLGDSATHRAFWTFLDQIAQVFWEASRNGVKLPIRSIPDVVRNLRAVSLGELPLVRFLNWTMGDALGYFQLREDIPLNSLLAMLVEDTVHSTLDAAPLINAALGITIRGAGLMRHAGGMYGFWQRFVAHYRSLRGQLRVGCKVEHVSGKAGAFVVHTTRGNFEAAQVVSAIPATLTAQIAPPSISRALQPYLERNEKSYGGAIVVFLGAPEAEVMDQAFTHHQLLQNYGMPLGNGNNMFISVSALGDTRSAPSGHRAVMISTHCRLEEWEHLSPQQYTIQKQAIGDCLIEYARRIYPRLGTAPRVYEIGTPQTYQRFTGRVRGATGGIRQNLVNSNQNAIPYDLGMKGFWMVGDSTWPGLGTVACVLGSRHVADSVRSVARHL